MPSPSHQAYRTSVLTWFRAHGHEPDVARQLQRYQEAGVVLWELDLEPARPFLVGCYASNPRGGDPWDPVLVLRCLLLMLLLGQSSLNAWAADLGAHRVMRVLAGLPGDERPGVGTFYDFLHRLHDGPIRRTCDHQERPSEAERRRAASPRPLQRNECPPAPPARKRGRPKGKKRDKSAVAAPVVDASATAKVVAELAATASSANPNDLLERLSAILVAVGVAVSLARGLLGDSGQLAVCGDGSPLVTGASRYGKRTCDHPKATRCECPPVFADPDARMGWDSYREKFFFGHHFYELIANGGGHDLPLAIRLDPGQTSDYTASVMTLDRLLKTARALPLTLRYFVADAGHDGEANYRYCLERGIRPVIPLRGKAPATHPKREDITLSPRGIPTCQAHVEMTSRGSAGEHRKVFACPVKTGAMKQCPLAPADEPGWLCQPATKHGPVVAVDVRLNPRLCPSVPRNSVTYTTLYKRRSGCERSNSVKKVTFKL